MFWLPDDTWLDDLVPALTDARMRQTRLALNETHVAGKLDGSVAHAFYAVSRAKDVKSRRRLNLSLSVSVTGFVGTHGASLQLVGSMRGSGSPLRGSLESLG